jgi:ACT domain-containing protein
MLSALLQGDLVDTVNRLKAFFLVVLIGNVVLQGDLVDTFNRV